MSERIALVGFVPTEEIMTDIIHRQSPDLIVDGYELFPNEAFGRIVNNRIPLYDHTRNGEVELTRLASLDQVSKLGYAAVNVGPDVAASLAGDYLAGQGVDYIGARPEELDIEQDKSKIAEIFPDATGVLPAMRVLTNPDEAPLRAAIADLGGNVIFKFVGDYSDFYGHSEYRRVRLMSEFENEEEMVEFVGRSIESSGKVVVQEFIEGQQFSYTCIVDREGHIFRFGENVFYKHRFEGDKGPFCDGTGSVAVNNTIPHLLGQGDVDFIEADIVTPYIHDLGDRFGKMPKTMLNVDLIKSNDGRIFLLEVNHRQPGGHTSANLFNGLLTPLVEVFQATQEGRLQELEPQYKSGASVVVSAFPHTAPEQFSDESERPVLTVPKSRAEDEVRMYTGWVDLESETGTTATIKSHLTATLIFESRARSVSLARGRVYQRLKNVVGDHLAYRSDIGLDFPQATTSH